MSQDTYPDFPVPCLTQYCHTTICQRLAIIDKVPQVNAHVPDGFFWLSYAGPHVEQLYVLALYLLFT